MENLLKETIRDLELFDKKPSDVLWVGSKNQVGTWEDFSSLADFDYDDGFGGNEIEDSLVIVGDNWWMERGEYDGSEWWEFKTLPMKQEKNSPLTINGLRESY